MGIFKCIYAHPFILYLLQNCEDVHVVVLHKEAGSGIGFTVAGGVDQNKPVTVSAYYL